MSALKLVDIGDVGKSALLVEGDSTTSLLRSGVFLIMLPRKTSKLMFWLPVP